MKSLEMEQMSLHADRTPNFLAVCLHLWSGSSHAVQRRRVLPMQEERMHDVQRQLRACTPDKPFGCSELLQRFNGRFSPRAAGTLADVITVAQKQML